MTNIAGIDRRTFLNQKSCGKMTLHDHHRPVGPGIRTERAVDEHERLELVAAVPGDEELHRVRVADHAPGDDHHLVHLLEMVERDDVLQLERTAGRRSGTFCTMAKPEKTAPATKYGGKIVVCQPGITETAKSKLTIVCTESTSGVANPARMRYARS